MREAGVCLEARHLGWDSGSGFSCPLWLLGTSMSLSVDCFPHLGSIGNHLTLKGSPERQRVEGVPVEKEASSHPSCPALWGGAGHQGQVDTGAPTPFPEALGRIFGQGSHERLCPWDVALSGTWSVLVPHFLCQ